MHKAVLHFLILAGIAPGSALFGCGGEPITTLTSATTGSAKHSGPSYMEAKTKCMGKLHDAMRTLNKVHKAYPVKQDDLEKAVEKTIRLGPPPLGGERFSQRQVK